MEIPNKDLKRRIIDISYRHKLSHIGSCITAVDIIEEIYKTKKPNEKFVLSSGHAGLALYVVIEKYEGLDAEKIFNHHGVHPDRCAECHIYCSGGSLGQGLPIAVGMALADKEKDVYCLISDGECAEGSIWEALRIATDLRLTNLRIHLNLNGYTAYDIVWEKKMKDRFIGFVPNAYSQVHKTNSDLFPFMQGLNSHYHVMSEEEYEEALRLLA